MTSGRVGAGEGVSMLGRMLLGNDDEESANVFGGADVALRGTSSILSSRRLNL